MADMKNIIQSVLILILTSVCPQHSVFSAKVEEVVLYAQVGDDVVLKNPVSYQLTTHYVYWTFDDPKNRNIAWRNSFNVKKTEDNPWNISMSWSGDSLTILKIKPEHFGTFICKVTLGSDVSVTRYKILQLSVTVNPKSLLLPGDSLFLGCGEAKPVKKPMIEWLNPQGQVTSRGQVEVSQVSSQDNGEWTCVVKYDRKQHHAKVSVSVMDLSPAPSQPQYTSKGSRLDIPCSIPSHISWEQIKAVEMQEVQWQFFPRQSSGHISNNPQLLFSLSPEDPLTWKSHQPRGLNVAPDPKKGSLSLTRKQGREDDRGNYMCSVKFKNGVSVDRTVHVEVLQILASPGTDLISGQQVHLNCSLGHPVSSDLQLIWSPPLQASHPSLESENHPAHLIIPHVGTEHRGSWGCALWQGSTKLTSDVIMLKIEPRLSVWMQVIICSAAAIVILLIILVFILCRRRQVQLNHSYSSLLDHTGLLTVQYVLTLFLSVSPSLWLTLAEDETPQATTLPVQKVRTNHFLDRGNGSKHAFTVTHSAAWKTKYYF